MVEGLGMRQIASMFCLSFVVLAALASPAVASVVLGEEALRAMVETRGFSPKWKKLPLRGEVPASKVPWADSNWPAYLGGTAYRWNAVKNEPKIPYFYGEAPTREEAERMSERELAGLSPLEKYHIFMGQFNYPLHKEVVAETMQIFRYDIDPRPIRSSEKMWAGICEDWATAALHYNEPQPVTLTGPSGIRVPFGSSDIKALLAEYIKLRAVAEAGVEGIESPDGDNLDILEDFHRKNHFGIGNIEQIITPGLFHIFLGNQLGLRRTGFVVDVRADYRIYFQPAFRFESRVLKERSGVEGAKTLEIETLLTTATDIKDPTSKKVEGTPASWEARIVNGQNVEFQHKFSYTLEISSSGKILPGGEWKSKQHPSKLFVETVKPGFRGLLKGLGQILEGPSELRRERSQKVHCRSRLNVRPAA